MPWGKAGGGGSNAGLAAEPPALPAPHPPPLPPIQAEAVPPWRPQHGAQSQLVGPQGMSAAEKQRAEWGEKAGE